MLSVSQRVWDRDRILTQARAFPRAFPTTLIFSSLSQPLKSCALDPILSRQLRDTSPGTLFSPAAINFSPLLDHAINKHTTILPSLKQASKRHFSIQEAQLHQLFYLQHNVHHQSP